MGHKLTEAERECLGLALHEAAHAVVGALQGRTVERAYVDADGVDGECEFAEGAFDGDRYRYAQALVAAAGPAASAIFAHGDNPSPRQLERHLGDADAEELRLATFHSDQNASEMLWNALPTVRRCWRSIGTLAAEMFAGGEVTHDDVLAALGVTDGGGPRSAQLSMIHSGATP